MTGRRSILAVLIVLSVVLGCLQIAEEILACACCARDRILVPSSTTAAAVSSQEVSIPRIFIPLNYSNIATRGQKKRGVMFTKLFVPTRPPKKVSLLYNLLAPQRRVGKTQDKPQTP